MSDQRLAPWLRRRRSTYRYVCGPQRQSGPALTAAAVWFDALHVILGMLVAGVLVQALMSRERRICAACGDRDPAVRRAASARMRTVKDIARCQILGIKLVGATLPLPTHTWRRATWIGCKQCTDPASPMPLPSQQPLIQRVKQAIFHHSQAPHASAPTSALGGRKAGCSS